MSIYSNLKIFNPQVLWKKIFIANEEYIDMKYIQISEYSIKKTLLDKIINQNRNKPVSEIIKKIKLSNLKKINNTDPVRFKY